MLSLKKEEKMCVNNVRTASVKRIYDEYVVKVCPNRTVRKDKVPWGIIRIINWVVESAKNKTYQTKKETKQNKQSKT